MNNVSVSVYITTYNNAKYIEQALDSVLMQKCDFDYEIVIGDNCSEDETRSILLEYQEQYSEKFKLLFHDEKLGLMSNFIETWEACSGKYVALLDANDYWQDPHKLQKQLEFLEKNDEYSACYHDTVVLGLDDIVKSETFGRHKDYSKEDQLCGMAVMQFSSRMIRNMKIVLPEYMLDLHQPDTIIGHFSGFHGKAAYLENIEKTVYRLYGDTLTVGSPKLEKLKSNVKTKEMIIKHLGEDSPYVDIVKKGIEKLYIDTLYVRLRDEKLKNYFAVWSEVLDYKQLNMWRMIVLHIEDIAVKIVAKIRK